MSEQQVYISVFEHPEFFDAEGNLLEKYYYLADWKLDYATRDRLMREALGPIREEQARAFREQDKQYITDYASTIKELFKDPNLLELERAQAAAAGARAAQQAEIDAYNEKERKRLAEVYSTMPGYSSWFSRANAEVLAAAPAAAAAPFAVDAAAEARRQLQMRYEQRLRATTSTNDRMLLEAEYAAALARQDAQAAAAQATAQIQLTAAPQPSRLRQIFDKVLRSINWRQR